MRKRSPLRYCSWVMLFICFWMGWVIFDSFMKGKFIPGLAILVLLLAGIFYWLFDVIADDEEERI